jgi:WD40 repeat protein
MIYFHLALLLNSLIISSLCNAMNESDHHLPLVRSFPTEKEILYVGFPTNNTILTMNPDGWATFCSETGQQKINIKNERHIPSYFDLSKDGKMAIVDRNNLTVHDIETGKIIYTKAMLDGLKRVAFCSNNDTLGVYNYTRGSITIYTIGKDKEEKYNISRYMERGPFVGNPTNKEFIIGNKIVQCVTDDEDAYLPRKLINILSSNYNPDGTVIAIKRKYKDGYLFRKRDGQYFVINSNKNSGKDNKYASYCSIAFHPKKRFAALITHDNNVEFWDYTKKTEKPLAVIGLPSKDDQTMYLYNDRLTAFAPNGEKLAVIIAGGNTFYTVPTPETAYYDDATKAQCVAFIWAIKNPDLPSIPQDIVKLIMHKLSRVPDFQVPKQIKPLEKKQQQELSPTCIIS